jgi:hypothetical protein
VFRDLLLAVAMRTQNFSSGQVLPRVVVTPRSGSEHCAIDCAPDVRGQCQETRQMRQGPAIRPAPAYAPWG